MTNDNTALTVIDNKALIPLDTELTEIFDKERKAAVKRFILGRTRPKAILTREGPKDKRGVPTTIRYVPGAYMIREVGLVTGFKWSHEVIGRRTLPDFWKAVESIQASKKDSYTKDEVVGCLLYTSPSPRD